MKELFAKHLIGCHVDDNPSRRIFGLLWPFHPLIQFPGVFVNFGPDQQESVSKHHDREVILVFDIVRDAWT